jgi:hypothetical protein
MNETDAIFLITFEVKNFKIFHSIPFASKTSVQAWLQAAKRCSLLVIKCTVFKMCDMAMPSAKCKWLR